MCVHGTGTWSENHLIKTPIAEGFARRRPYNVKNVVVVYIIIQYNTIYICSIL